jgi:hypothetical protein
MGPDEELLGVVVHSGLLLGRNEDTVAALRRITAFPGGLALDTVVLARDIYAEAAGRRAHAAMARRQAAERAQREDEAVARQDSEAAARREGTAAAERHHALQAAMIERRYLPRFEEGDLLRLGVATPAGGTRWLDAYGSSSSETRGPLPAGSHLLADAAPRRRPGHPRLLLAGDRSAGNPERPHASGPGGPCG